MSSVSLFPDWHDLVRWSGPGPQPAIMVDEPGLRVLVAGLEPGAAIPVHPGPPAVYHVLEGVGQVTIDGEQSEVSAGMTVVVADGATRGFEARTRLAFLGVRLGGAG